MLVTILAIWSSLETSAAFPSGSTSPTTNSGEQSAPDVCFSHTSLLAEPPYLRSQANKNTSDGTRLLVTTVPNTNSLTTGFSSTTPSTVGSIQPIPPLGHPSALGLLIGGVILLCVIISVIIFYLLRVRGQRLPQQSSEPTAKTPVTLSKIHICQVTEVPELVANDIGMIDIRSPWSPINPRKPEPLRTRTEVGQQS
jgi:hypothetical protein